MNVITITMNTYQMVNEDEIIPSLLASDSNRGGGIEVVISESNGQPDGERIQQTWNPRSNEWDVCCGESNEI